MIRAFDEVFIRNIQTGFAHRPQEAGQTDVADRVLTAVDEGDALVPLGNHVAGESLDTLPVFGLDTGSVVENVVDGDQRNRTGDELENFAFVEVAADDADAVHIAIAAMLEISHLGTAHVVGDKGDIVAPAFGFLFKGLQHGGEKAVGQTAFGIVRIEDAKVECAPDLQASGDGTGTITQFIGCGSNLLLGFFADIGVVVQGFADG